MEKQTGSWSRWKLFPGTCLRSLGLCLTSGLLTMSRALCTGKGNMSPSGSHQFKPVFKGLSRASHLCVFLSVCAPPLHQTVSLAGMHIPGERAVYLMVAQRRSGPAASGAMLLLPVWMLPKLPALSLQLFIGNNINHAAWFFSNSSQSNHRLKCRLSCRAFISKSDFEHLSAKVRFKHHSCNVWKKDLFRQGLCQSVIFLPDSAINYCCNYLSSWTFKMSSEGDDYIF